MENVTKVVVARMRAHACMHACGHAHKRARTQASSLRTRTLHQTPRRQLMHETSMRKTSADDANREKADNETKTVVEAARPWRQPKPTKTSRPRTLVRSDTSAVDSGAASSARVSGTAATKRKRVWVSFKPSTQYARPRRRDPPEDLESKAPKRADRGWCHESRRFEELPELISGSLM